MALVHDVREVSLRVQRRSVEICSIFGSIGVQATDLSQASFFSGTSSPNVTLYEIRRPAIMCTLRDFSWKK